LLRPAPIGGRGSSIGCAGTGSARRRIVSATSGKIKTDRRPAAISPAEVAASSRPSSTPIIEAATINGSDVARSSPATTVWRVPIVER
jgi:hypothetical protein